MTYIQQLNGDQSRELINTSQRFDAYRHADEHYAGYRGSMSFVERNEAAYLVRDYYDPKSGVRRQKSLGRKNAATQNTYEAFVKGKEEAAERRRSIAAALDRQAAVNRALRLGRVPEIGARVIRSLDDANLLGKGLKIVGTNALFAYEAMAGVQFAPEITTTEDIDFLFDARARIRIAMDEGVEERTLIGVLKQADKSFQLARRTFQAVNSDGYQVDLIKPERNPPWKVEPDMIGRQSPDLEASPIHGLAWHESAPTFESVAIDSRGYPLRIVAPDPRAFVVHKLWLSRQLNRNPAKKQRDRQQAEAVAALTAMYLPHLPFEIARLRSFPKEIVMDAKPMFDATSRSQEAS